MARYQVILAYDGTEFLGYQRQKNARSVQGEVEAALRKIGWDGKTILSAGRTDTGVHAAGQVIAFDLDWRHDPGSLRQALNANLPADISARQVCEADASFHPRYGASSREYCYRILIDPVRFPKLERTTWRMDGPLNFALLQQSAALFVGEHDFSAFGNPPRPSGNTVRTVLRSEWQTDGNLVCYTVRANAFLYHMVRRLVFVQVVIATGRADIQSLASNLAEGLPDFPGIAPARGLELTSVQYGE
jgi:tRNA pseudouridine38-40 synthase